MLTNCEQKIMELMLPQPFKCHSIKSISRLIKSSYALTYDSVQSLIEKRLIRAEKIGNTLSCMLNLSADPQMLAASALELSRKLLGKAHFGFVVDNIKKRLKKQIYIMILFGSYAKGTATKKSDIDLLFVVQNAQEIEAVRKEVKSALSMTSIEVEFDVVTTDWLVKMFEEKNTVGREVLEASIILHGAEQYYTLVNEYDKERGY